MGKSGLATAAASDSVVSIIDLGTFSKFEYLSVKLQSPNAPSQITCLYRQPETVSSAFCDELSDLFDQLLQGGERQVVCGDFNCPGNDGTLLDDSGNTLDLIITQNRLVSSFETSVCTCCFSVTIRWFVVGLECHRLVRQLSHTHIANIKQMDLQWFRHAVLTSRLYNPDVLELYTADAYTELFEAEISRVLDLCPITYWHATKRET
jgi:hypothetical protein